MIKEELVHAFCSDKDPGSPQYLHLYASYEEMLSSYEQANVNDEWDHSHLYIKEDNVHIRWKNKKGPIYFCGSGAYAAICFLIEKNKLKKLTLISNDQKFSVKQEHQIQLEIPSYHSEHLLEREEGNLFHHSKSGIYLFQVRNENDLLNEDLIKELKDQPEIHGLCVYYWDREKKEGALRYFVPWHGRDEDYVTGSIHQYLTPLVAGLWDAPHQRWRQMSSSPGILNSTFDDKKVNISGNYKIK